MHVTCEHCGEPALPSDSTCWHCGKPLGDLAEKNAEVVTASDGWQGSGKTSAVLAYSIMTILVIVAALVIMGMIGSQPMLQIAVGTQTPKEWKSISPADKAFFVNLPEEWTVWHGADAEQSESLNRRLSENEFLTLGTHPFGAEVDDLKISFLAQEGNAINGTPHLFLVIANSQKLAGLSYDEAIQFLSNSDYQVRETRIVDNFDKSNLSIYVRTPLDDEQEDVLLCRQQFITGDADVMLVALCAPAGRFLGQQAQILTILESFQRLSR